MNKANCHFCGEDVPAIKQRIAELQRTQERLVAFSADNSRELQKQVDRLWELLRECSEQLKPKCPNCGKSTTTDHNSVRCDSCKMLWPKSMFDLFDRIEAELAKGEANRE